MRISSLGEAFIQDGMVRYHIRKYQNKLWKIDAKNYSELLVQNVVVGRVGEKETI